MTEIKIPVEVDQLEKSISQLQGQLAALHTALQEAESMLKAIVKDLPSVNDDIKEAKIQMYGILDKDPVSLANYRFIKRIVATTEDILWRANESKSVCLTRINDFKKSIKACQDELNRLTLERAEWNEVLIFKKKGAKWNLATK